MHAISLIIDMVLYIVFFEFVFIQVKVYETCRVGVEDLTHIYEAWSNQKNGHLYKIVYVLPEHCAKIFVFRCIFLKMRVSLCLQR